jgi:glycosyltransferase involved in cell wall biosynthesis
MQNKLSVIITVRGNEPHLKQTISNIKHKAGCKTEIICVYDGSEPDTTLEVDQILHLKHPRGIGPARHRGIQAAAAKVVFLTDAHMDFSQGFGKTVLQHHDKNPHTVSCGCCVPMFDQGGKLFWNEKERCTATRFVLTSDEPGGEHWVMSGKWAAQTPGNPVGCVYGACYGMTVKHYKAIGEPLALLTGWGMDEEYLSAATWLSGGRCHLLPYDAAHLFRAKPSFNTARYDAVLRLVNRARFVFMLPAPEADLSAMETALNLNLMFHDSDFADFSAKDGQRKEVQDAIKLWKTWDWTLLNPWIDRRATPLPARMEAAVKRRTPDLIPRSSSTAPRVQVRDVFQCPQCGSMKSFRVRCTEKRITEERRYGRCRTCHHPGVIVCRDGFERLTWNG